MSRRNGGESPLRFEWERVIKALPLPPMVKLVALTLATYGDLDGCDVRPGSEALIGDTGASRATVWRALAYLREVGLIVSVVPANRRRGIAEQYRLDVPADILQRVVQAPVQGSHRALNGPVQGSQGNGLGLTQKRLGLTQKHDGAHTEPPPTHDHLSDHLMTTSETHVLDVPTDRARAVDGHPRRRPR
jgi:biotin operon repressor